MHGVGWWFWKGSRILSRAPVNSCSLIPADSCCVVVRAFSLLCAASGYANRERVSQQVKHRARFGDLSPKWAGRYLHEVGWRFWKRSRVVSRTCTSCSLITTDSRCVRERTRVRLGGLGVRYKREGEGTTDVRGKRSRGTLKKARSEARELIRRT